MSGRVIRTGHSGAVDARQVVRDFRDAVVQPDMSLVVFFCSADYDLNVLADEMHRCFPDTEVVGCTTAGEIGPAGYRGHSLSGFSLSARAFTAATGCLGSLQAFSLGDTQNLVQRMLQRLESKAPGASPDNSFGFLLIDGASGREELATHTLQTALGRLPLFGGSAGDGLRFQQPYMYYDGQFHTDSLLLTLVTTSLPFTIFKTQHFAATEERMVVTSADPSRRRVMEINGLPAAAEYARLVGVDPSQLDPMRFAFCPVAVLIGGNEYVRSIQCANPDGSLTFYCAIEEGLVLRIARGDDLPGNLEAAFKRIHETVGVPQLVIGCDCILRNREVIYSGHRDRVEQILKANNTVGFNTYGEQYYGVHVNQTLTGIAIGAAPGKGRD